MIITDIQNEISKRQKEFQEYIKDTYEELILQHLKILKETTEDYEEFSGYIDTDFQSEGAQFHISQVLRDLFIDLSVADEGEIYDYLSENAQEAAELILQDAKFKKQEEE